jgi:hypothetical protein
MTIATLSGNIYTEDASIARQVETADIVYPRWTTGWIIINPQKYRHIPEIEAAMRDRGRQVSMFAGFDGGRPRSTRE